MENTNKNQGKDGKKQENTLQYPIESIDSKGGTLVSKRCRKKFEPGRTLILNARKSRASTWCRELFLKSVHGSSNSIPKHITTPDEKYVLRCLELIRNCALRAAAWNFTSKVGVLPEDGSNLAEIKNRSSNSISLAIERPLIGGTEVIMNSTGEWTIGTVSRSQSIINILTSPLLQQFGSFDRDVNFGRTDLLDVSEPFHSYFGDSPQESRSTLSRKLQKEVKFLDHKHASSPVHKRDASASSTNSSCSDQSSSSVYGTSFQGMLQCTWKDGLPHHVFTVDDKREVYIANLSKVESSDDKGLDYVYTFLARRSGKKECDIDEIDSESIAKMRVSTTITFSSNNSEVRESQFILSVSSDNRKWETQTSNHALRKNNRLTTKVVDVFRPSHAYKQRSLLKLGGSSAIFEDTPWDPSGDVNNNYLDPHDGLAQNKCSRNLELAAIIVKDICHNSKEAELGGWGLKFLKRHGNKASLESSIPPERSRNTGECSTSTDILIPAGLHGGPRTRVGSGPSSLIERWTSGGHCDCGGWDIGCPLTILNTMSSNRDYTPQADNSGECKSVDLFMQGSKQNIPIMKMVNIHDGLYYIHFQPTLSTLQSFAIAAAIIHSRSPLLRPKVYRS
ncbi:hypothetical protein Salat_2132000 [Sesamum alatum]|uniref:DUF3527 domain protein n=1 Tax=Sesamum alatum TaxID=300844 RepID=A0AAE1Y242_9LAMI|nr:hypothetical protein Salat_2132000 [Sesamum alatum]